MDHVILDQAGNGLEPADEGNLIVQVVSDIVSSVFDGGVNRGLVVGMHASFAGLVLTLLALWVLTEYNGHVLALTAISLCLWATTGWFVMELLAGQRVKLEEDARKAAATAAASASDDDATAETTATDVSSPISKPISKEAAIAQFQKAVSEAQAETKKAR